MRSGATAACSALALTLLPRSGGLIAFRHARLDRVRA
jgi:hypothetical protein